MLTDLLDIEALTALVSVILIDIALAGDNAIIVGMAAAGLPADLRRRAIVIGVAAAAILRVVFASFTVQLLEIIGLMLAGGLLLLWVAWKLWREIRRGYGVEEAEAHAVLSDEDLPALSSREKSLRDAVTQIIIADVSMSLDNVLAVAGAARDHAFVLILGLALSVALMGFAASLVAHLLRRYAWIAYLGLAIIVYVALSMIWNGTREVLATI